MLDWLEKGAFMINWIDIGIIAIVGLSIYTSYKKGFLNSVLGLAGFIVSILAAKLFYLDAAKWLYAKFIPFRHVKDAVYDQALKSFTKGGDGISALHIPSNLQEMLRGFIDKAAESTHAAQASLVSDLVANAMAFIIIMIIVQICFAIAAVVMNRLTKLPVLREINGFLSVIYGAVKGVVIVYAIMAVVSFTTPVIYGTELVKTINGSFVGSIFYNYNLIIYIMNAII